METPASGFQDPHHFRDKAVFFLRRDVAHYMRRHHAIDAVVGEWERGKLRPGSQSVMARAINQCVPRDVDADRAVGPLGEDFAASSTAEIKQSLAATNVTPPKTPFAVGPVGQDTQNQALEAPRVSMIGDVMPDVLFVEALGVGLGRMFVGDGGVGDRWSLVAA